MADEMSARATSPPVAVPPTGNVFSITKKPNLTLNVSAEGDVSSYTLAKGAGLSGSPTSKDGKDMEGITRFPPLSDVVSPSKDDKKVIESRDRMSPTHQLVTAARTERERDERAKGNVETRVRSGGSTRPQSELRRRQQTDPTGGHPAGGGGFINRPIHRRSESTGTYRPKSSVGEGGALCVPYGGVSNNNGNKIYRLKNSNADRNAKSPRMTRRFHATTHIEEREDDDNF